jgi:hypothetical protein
MRKPVDGMFYLQYADEDWQQALDSHNIPGFRSIEDARGEADHAIATGQPYVVKDHCGNQVWPVIREVVIMDVHQSSTKTGTVQCTVMDLATSERLLTAPLEQALVSIKENGYKLVDPEGLLHKLAQQFTMEVKRD